MTTHKVKGIMTSRLLKLIQEGTQSTKELATVLGAPENTIRVLRCRLRRYGLLPGYQPNKTVKPRQSKSTCPTCGGRRWVEVRTGDTVTYKPCSDCLKSNLKTSNTL